MFVIGITKLSHKQGNHVSTQQSEYKTGIAQHAEYFINKMITYEIQWLPIQLFHVSTSTKSSIVSLRLPEFVRRT